MASSLKKRVRMLQRKYGGSYQGTLNWLEYNQGLIERRAQHEGIPYDEAACQLYELGQQALKEGTRVSYERQRLRK